MTTTSLRAFFTHTLLPTFLLVTLFPAITLAEFNDVSKHLKQYDAITTLETEGIIKGFADGSFKPNNLITRAEFIKLVFAHIGYLPKNSTAKTIFKDVPEDSWFAPYVEKALELNAVGVDPENPVFMPSAPVMKIDGLKIIMQLEGIPMPYFNDSSPLPFKDVKPTSPYAYIVRAADNAGLSSSLESTYFHPLKSITRAETAEFLYRAELYRESGFGISITPTFIDFGSTLNNSDINLISNPKFPILLDVWGKINSKFVNTKDIKPDELIYGAVSGMVNTLNDPYSVFEAPTAAAETQNTLDGSFEGIGTVLDQLKNDILIIKILDNSPAQKAGLKEGDIIKKVDDQTIAGLTIEKVIDLIKGAAGTKVKLEIDRNGQTLNFTIQRGKLSLDSVMLQNQPELSKTAIPSNISYVSIYQFSTNTGKEFADILKTELAKKPIGLILDLRDDPGGYLSSAYDVLGHFIPKDQIIMYIKTNSQKNEQQLSEGEGEIKNSKLPLVVLINENTASAAEVVSAAIQDYKIGKLIGEQSYGKGTVQEITDYTDGSLLKISIAHWLSPLLKDINKVGLTPDIKSSLTKDDLTNGTDSQLQRAIQEIRTMAK